MVAEPVGGLGSHLKTRGPGPQDTLRQDKACQLECGAGQRQRKKGLSSAPLLRDTPITPSVASPLQEARIEIAGVRGGEHGGAKRTSGQGPENLAETDRPR